MKGAKILRTAAVIAVFAGLLLVLVTCDLFKPSLTIINNSSHDIDRIEWIVNGEEYWFGDDSV